MSSQTRPNSREPLARRAFKPREFAEATGLSLKTVLRRIADQQIASTKIGARVLIPLSELERLTRPAAEKPTLGELLERTAQLDRSLEAAQVLHSSRGRVPHREAIT